MDFLSEEKKLWKKGYKRVVCLDEAGRGPLAGPVVASAVTVLNAKYRMTHVGIKDSKKLSQKQRERFYKCLTRDSNIKWGIGSVSEKVIDKINILEATKLAMGKAVKNLKNKLGMNSYDRGFSSRKIFLILDGKMSLNLPIPQKSIVKADGKVFSCIAAGILAKVTRDRIMQRFHKKYPHYGFDRHKGYPTRLHCRMLKRYGRCAIHRNSFQLKSKLH